MMHQEGADRRGVFVVSLDFELYWGVFDLFQLSAYRHRLLGARKAIPAMLRAFDQHDIHATWATVGFLFFDSREELIEACPTLRPAYVNQVLCPYRRLPSIGRNEADDPFHFGLSLVRTIGQFPNQEIATHTFSHYYCLEAGQNADTFRADLRAACLAAARHGLTLKSIVFPRNQCNPQYLDVCRQAGLIAYRGVEKHWFSEPARAPHKRAARLLDAYAPLSGYNCHDIVQAPALPIGIPASRFMRCEWRSTAARRLLLNRILSGISFAATHGRIYHLWWHPHNLGHNPDESMEFLAAILDHVAELRKRYEMLTRNMAELAQTLEESKACV